MLFVDQHGRRIADTLLLSKVGVRKLRLSYGKAERSMDFPTAESVA